MTYLWHMLLVLHFLSAELPYLHFSSRLMSGALAEAAVCRQALSSLREIDKEPPLTKTGFISSSQVVNLF